MEKHEQTIEDTQIFFYRVPVAAKAISVSKGKVWSLIRENIIPSYKMGSITLVKASELFQYVERFKHEAKNKNGDI